MRKRTSCPVSLTLFRIVCLATSAMPTTSPASAQAGKILDAAGVKGGLVVHIGCGDGALTAALGAGESYLVHGLDACEANVQRARESIRSRGLYGRVSVMRWDGKSLPYRDNLVNLVVVEELDDLSIEEVMRVLAPRGVAYVRQGGRWNRSIKPWPAQMDEWTHFLHDASNNAVARDSLVGPPRGLKWTCGPQWSRSHEFSSSLCAMVSGSGRVFYILDQGLTGVTARQVPEQWTLIARDAFNGLLLWSRAMPKWGSEQWNSRALRNIPGTVPRRLVAQGNRLFVTLGYDAPVSMLDAATGEVLATFDGTADVQEIRGLDDILILRLGANVLTALDTRTGQTLWRRQGRVQPFSLAAQDDRLFCQEAGQVVSLRVSDGRQLWHAPAEAPLFLLLVHGDALVLLDRAGLRVLAAETGAPLWTAKIGSSRRELFAVNGQLWCWDGTHVVGRDLRSGTVTTRLNTDDVFTAGHHFRCYQSKATERFLITPNRGAEFVSLTGGEHTQNDWTRGPCGYGVMPGNGLLYVPPHPCFCYPGVELTGFNALAPAGPEGSVAPAERLERGPAYGQAKELLPATAEGGTDWPTYRHDARRSGATAAGVSPRLSQRWSVLLRGALTPPVVCGNRVYVAAKDRHTLQVLGADEGQPLWHYTADARIDSPPTVYGGLVLFGCADGSVYCLRAADGELLWRFRAAPSEQLILADGQLESPWRVHGSVLIEDGLAYVTAGRSSWLDGGIFLFALDPATGRAVHQACLDTWARMREDAKGKPFIPGYHMEGARSDILVSQGGGIYLGQAMFDRRLTQREAPYILPDPNRKTVAMDLSGRPFVGPDEDPNADYETHQREWLERTQKHLLADLRSVYDGYSLGQRQMGLHLLSVSGFLDDSWYNRTYWMYSATWPGYYLAHRGAKTGQLLVVGPDRTYGVQAYPSRNLQSPLFTPGEKGYLLFADDNDNEPILDDRTQGTTKGWGFTRAHPPVWHHWVSIRIRAMVLAQDTLFIAGPPDVVDAEDPMASFEGRKGGRLRALAAADGSQLSEYKLDAPPVFDGMIAARGCLFVVTTDGRVICLQGDKSETAKEKS